MSIKTQCVPKVLATTQGRRECSSLRSIAMEETKQDLGESITNCESDMEAVQFADALALITERTELRVPNWEKVGSAIKSKAVFDGLYLYLREIVGKVEFDYYGIGIGENIAEKMK